MQDPKFGSQQDPMINVAVTEQDGYMFTIDLYDTRVHLTALSMVDLLHKCSIAYTIWVGAAATALLKAEGGVQ